MPDFLDMLRTAQSTWASASPVSLSQIVDMVFAHPIISFEIICAGALVFCVRTGARI